MATITIAELATTLETDARTTRKFMRAITPKDAQPGKGSRWAIEKREVRSLRSKFSKFAAEEEARKAALALAKAEADNATETPEIDPALDSDNPDFDDQSAEPTDADIEAIDLESALNEAYGV